MESMIFKEESWSRFPLEPTRKYQEIKARCLAEGKRFEDEEFPTTYMSIHPANENQYGNTKWLRPSDITGIKKPPRLVVDGPSRMDVRQYGLGDCWLMAPMAVLASDKKLFHRVVPLDQGFEEGQYFGAFRFCFWRYGDWVEVIVDDRLPTNHKGELLFAQAPGGEMWSALLEKAFAKLRTSYIKIYGGFASESLTDFTGGIVRSIKLESSTADYMFEQTQKAHFRNYFIAAATIHENNLGHGMSGSHVYSVTSTACLNTGAENVQLIRFRNPLGGGKGGSEWDGAWSDKSEKWNMISEECKKELELEVKKDGEFWMAKDDVMNFFREIYITYDPFLNRDTNTHFKVGGYHDSWVENSNAGGRSNDLDKFAMNPQYVVSLKDADDDEDDKCTLVVSLMQKNYPGYINAELKIGFDVYPILDSSQKYIGRNGNFTPQFFRETKRCMHSEHIKFRTRTETGLLPTGKYCIVPSTANPNENGDFYLRIMMEKERNTSCRVENYFNM